jgi:hypothetical protein
MQKQRNLLLFLLVVALCACSNQKTEVLFGKSITEMKELVAKSGKPFCIVISRSDCSLCSDYVRVLSGGKSGLTGKAIFNVVDITKPENEWYPMWLASMASPATCIFSAKGDLQAVVSGKAEQCITCIGNVLKGEPECAFYLYSKHYEVNGDVFPVLNTILQCKLRFDAGDDIEPEISQTPDKIVYPYNIYLKCLNAKKNGDEEAAKAMAEHLLKFGDAYNIHLYKKIFAEAKTIVNPDYSPENDAVLTVEKKIRLEDCVLNVARLFSIEVENTGKSELRILDITASCSCVSLVSGKTHTVAPDKSVKIDFEFRGDREGEIFREIFFTSNGVNPQETVELTATVSKTKN